tara:strand:+ start:778 stop:1668 length:891 start_codon:yes stop_codon:yes gene_type:complete
MSNFDLPGELGLLDKPIKIQDTNIEIVRDFDPSQLEFALFDFDGTLSRERDGWVNLMVASMSAIMSEVLPIEQARIAVLENIEANIGLPTFTGLRKLNEYRDELGWRRISTKTLKNIYNDQLLKMVDQKRADIKDGVLDHSELVVFGTYFLLDEIKKRYEDNMYVASGSDKSAVAESVDLLEMTKYFGDRVLAAGDLGDPEKCAKKHIIEELVRDKDAHGKILTFGDGFPEILHTYHNGGVCVGVITSDCSNDEHLGYLTIEKKRKRLMDAGAHIIIPNYKNTPALIKVIHDKDFS